MSKDTAELPDIPPEQMADELVLELGDMAIEILEGQVKYWTAALEEARRQLDKPVY